MNNIMLPVNQKISKYLQVACHETINKRLKNKNYNVNYNASCRLIGLLLFPIATAIERIILNAINKN